MLKLQELKHLGNAIIANDTGIKDVFYCVDEEHVMAKLKDKPGILMVILYPQTDGTGKQNEEVDQNATWIFLLEKNISDQSNDKEFAQFEKLQQHMEKIRNLLQNKFDSCEFRYLNRYQPSRVQIMPEYNQFGGFNGWSMSLVV